eukprot:4245141-Amphidinium_carterae.1
MKGEDMHKVSTACVCGGTCCPTCWAPDHVVELDSLLLTWSVPVAQQVGHFHKSSFDSSNSQMVDLHTHVRPQLKTWRCGCHCRVLPQAYNRGEQIGCASSSAGRVLSVPALLCEILAINSIPTSVHDLERAHRFNEPHDVGAELLGWSQQLAIPYVCKEAPGTCGGVKCFKPICAEGSST